jgi:hypothetical protein
VGGLDGHGPEPLLPTQPRKYYDALHAMKAEEETAPAKFDADDPARLFGRFELSVKTVGEYLRLDEEEDFHSCRAERTRSDAKPDEPIGSTADSPPT